MDNQTIVDMELESPCSEGLGDRDERFRIPTPPIIESITEIPLVEPNITVNDDLTTSVLKEINDDQAKQIIVPDLSMEIEDHSNRSGDEFVKVLNKEVSIPKSPSPTQIVNSIQQSHDENNESNLDATVSPTSTVTLIPNDHQDNLVVKTTNIDQPEAQKEEEPTAKRIKVDLLAPPPPPNPGFGLLSIYQLFSISL